MITWKTPAGNAQNLYINALSQTHLLIGGTTGSGKSVLVNGLIYTALFQAPSQNQFILIDPKRVELCEYKSLPHVLQYASEPQTMTSALEYAMNVIESRFSLMQSQNVKKWAGGNVYVIIDELADLMTTNRKPFSPCFKDSVKSGEPPAFTSSPVLRHPFPQLFRHKSKSILTPVLSSEPEPLRIQETSWTEPGRNYFRVMVRRTIQPRNISRPPLSPSP